MLFEDLKANSKMMLLNQVKINFSVFDHMFCGIEDTCTESDKIILRK